MSKPSQAQSKDDAIGDAAQAERLATRIAATVMNTLGRPTDLFRVSVVRLWGNRYRVNVQTGPNAVSALIAHSYFLEVDETGAVVASTPVITRLY